uniref:catechol O-methyltransferase n=1 Tax=Astatotilapia calliptera TaxID=8154 RepID=A0A3P8QRA8_ASTCA
MADSHCCAVSWRTGAIVARHDCGANAGHTDPVHTSSASLFFGWGCHGDHNYYRDVNRLLHAVQKNATKGDPRSVVKAIDNFCRQKEWAMNVGDEKGCILDSVVSEVNPVTVLELGTYCGYSTVRIASLLPPRAKIITLEFNPDYAKIARQVIAWAGLEDKIQVVEGPSGEWIPKMKEQFGVKTFDLVFLDHWKDRYLPDTKLLEDCGLLRKGTILLADNVICPGTPDYLEYVRNSPRYKSQYFKSHLEYTKAEDGLEKSVFLG